VSSAQLSALAIESMITQGITTEDVCVARSLNSKEDGFLNLVRSFNDHHSCCRDSYTVRARLVGDDYVDGEQLLFALLHDTFEILSFPTCLLLLPGEESRRVALLQELVIQASEPPAHHDDEDDASVRVLLSVNDAGNKIVCKCVQEKHFLTRVDDMCPKLLLCGWAPCQLVLIMSYDFNTVLNVFRLNEGEIYDGYSNHPLLLQLISDSE
jgi:hypothetical protein